MRDVFVAQASEVAEGGRKVIVADGVEVGVFRIGGKLVAWRNQCPHQGGPVCQGRLLRRVEERLDADKRSLGIHYVEDGKVNIVCPWHGWEFDAATGRHAGLDQIRLASIPVKERDGAVYVVVNS